MDARIWGATETERAARYPCDDIGFAYDEPYYRAIDVAAPAPLAYRWLAQLRVAPYSYDLLDNFGRRSPPELVPVAEPLQAGQRVMTIFRLVAFESGASLTIRLASRAGRTLMGDVAGTYSVRERWGGSRIVAKVLVRYPAGPYGRVLRRAMPAADLIMFRKQLLTLRRYAERDAARISLAASVR